MKLTYICDYTSEEDQLGAVPRSYEHTRPKITMEFEATTIEAMLKQFKDFLLGCGFVIDGEIVLECQEPSCDKYVSWMHKPSDIRPLSEEERSK